jgi:hypothetical protein
MKMTEILYMVLVLLMAGVRLQVKWMTGWEQEQDVGHMRNLQFFKYIIIYLLLRFSDDITVNKSYYMCCSRVPYSCWRVGYLSTISEVTSQHYVASLR